VRKHNESGDMDKEYFKFIVVGAHKRPKVLNVRTQAP